MKNEKLLANFIRTRNRISCLKREASLRVCQTLKQIFVFVQILYETKHFTDLEEAMRDR